MLVTMLMDREDSLNDGRTSQLFAAGQRYEIPDPVGRVWIEQGIANAVNGSMFDGRRAGSEQPRPSNPDPRTKR